MRPGRHPRWTPAEPRVALGGQIRTLRVATPQRRSRPNSSGDRAADYRARAESVPDRKLRALDVRTAVLNDNLEGDFRHRYPGFRPTNDDQVRSEAA